MFGWCQVTKLADAAVTGSLRVDVQRTFPLDSANEALQAFSGGTLGKLVLVAG